jgi:hypothetical protein
MQLHVIGDVGKHFIYVVILCEILVESKPFIVWTIKDTLYIRFPFAGERGINTILCDNNN